MTEELETLFEVSSCLENAKIPYMICGSMAMNYYATPRMTRDIDLVVEMGLADAERITNILDPDFFIDLDSVRDATRKRRMFSAVHRKTLIKIDFVVRKDERFREEEFGRRRQVVLEGRRIWMVSPEDLLLSKLYWAKDSRSEMQLRDARNLLASVKLDEVYVDRWAAVLGIEDAGRGADMNDTSPEMEKLHRDLLMSRSGSERVRMACSMFATAKAMALASFGDISPTEKRVRFFLRFYGDDLDEKTKQRIVAEIRKEFPTESALSAGSRAES